MARLPTPGDMAFSVELFGFWRYFYDGTRDWIVDAKPGFMDIVQFNADEIQYKYDENPMNWKAFQSNADPALADSKDHIALQG